MFLLEFMDSFLSEGDKRKVAISVLEGFTGHRVEPGHCER